MQSICMVSLSNCRLEMNDAFVEYACKAYPNEPAASAISKIGVRLKAFNERIVRILEAREDRDGPEDNILAICKANLKESVD